VAIPETRPRSTLVGVLALLTLLAAAAAASISVAAHRRSERIAAGAKVFSSTCAGCHGKEARGSKGFPVDLRSGLFVRTNSDAQLVDFIERGRPKTDPSNRTHFAMPPKGGNPELSREDLAAVVAYLRSLE
jgi:mono/diheme cytochrome c family protein